MKRFDGTKLIGALKGGPVEAARIGTSGVRDWNISAGPSALKPELA